MFVMHVERRKGEYFDPEVIDLDDGSGCLFKFHESDISDKGAIWLSEILTEQARVWGPRPAGAPLGPVIPVTFERAVGLPEPIAIRLDDQPDRIAYTIDADIISDHAAKTLGEILTGRSPFWQRVPEGYHDDNDAG